jgi:hypothetical protein
MSKVAAAVNENTITCVIGGNVHTIQRDHPEAGQILRALNDDWAPEEVLALFDKIKAMAAYMRGSVEVRGNAVYCGGEPIHNVVAERILEFMGDDLPYQPLVKFLDCIQNNPSRWSVEQLYTFLEHKNLPITPDGKFLAYKAIRNNWTDKYSGSFKNTVGSTLSMKRNKVDDDPDRHCSYGFHVGSLEYVEGFAYGYGNPGGDRIVIVEVDPADVVSVPRDCNCQKVRTCKYTVVAEYTGPLPEKLVVDSTQPYDDDAYDPSDVRWADDNEGQEEEDAYTDGYNEGFRDALAKLSDVADNMDPDD